MAFVTGDIVPSDDAEFPFKVVFMKGDEVVSEWFVATREDGEAQVLECLERLAEEDEEDEEDEAGEDGDEEYDEEDEEAEMEQAS